MWETGRRGARVCAYKYVRSRLLRARQRRYHAKPRQESTLQNERNQQDAKRQYEDVYAPERHRTYHLPAKPPSKLQSEMHAFGAASISTAFIWFAWSLDDLAPPTHDEAYYNTASPKSQVVALKYVEIREGKEKRRAHGPSWQQYVCSNC